MEGSSTPTSRQEPPMSEKPISPLRRRMIEDMSVRKFGEKTQHDYIRHIEQFAKFLGRSPDTATGEDLRRYQVHQTESGVQPPTVRLGTACSLSRTGFKFDHRLRAVEQRILEEGFDGSGTAANRTTALLDVPDCDAA